MSEREFSLDHLEHFRKEANRIANLKANACGYIEGSNLREEFIEKLIRKIYFSYIGEQF